MTLRKPVIWLIALGMLALLHVPNAAVALPFNLGIDVPD